MNHLILLIFITCVSFTHSQQVELNLHGSILRQSLPIYTIFSNETYQIFSSHGQTVLYNQLTGYSELIMSEIESDCAKGQYPISPRLCVLPGRDSAFYYCSANNSMLILSFEQGFKSVNKVIKLDDKVSSIEEISFNPVEVTKNEAILMLFKGESKSYVVVMDATLFQIITFGELAVSKGVASDLIPLKALTAAVSWTEDPNNSSQYYYHLYLGTYLSLSYLDIIYSWGPTSRSWKLTSEVFYDSADNMLVWPVDGKLIAYNLILQKLVENTIEVESISGYHTYEDNKTESEWEMSLFTYSNDHFFTYNNGTFSRYKFELGKKWKEEGSIISPLNPYFSNLSDYHRYFYTEDRYGILIYRGVMLKIDYEKYEIENILSVADFIEEVYFIKDFGYVMFTQTYFINLDVNFKYKSHSFLENGYSWRYRDLNNPNWFWFASFLSPNNCTLNLYVATENNYNAQKQLNPSDCGSYIKGAVNTVSLMDLNFSMFNYEGPTATFFCDNQEMFTSMDLSQYSLLKTTAENYLNPLYQYPHCEQGSLEMLGVSCSPKKFTKKQQKSKFLEIIFEEEEEIYADISPKKLTSTSNLLQQNDDNLCLSGSLYYANLTKENVTTVVREIGNFTIAPTINDNYVVSIGETNITLWEIASGEFSVFHLPDDFVVLEALAFTKSLFEAYYTLQLSNNTIISGKFGLDGDFNSISTEITTDMADRVGIYFSSEVSFMVYEETFGSIAFSSYQWTIPGSKE